jgi:transcriptional regulator with XRE-family HTH domain
MATVTSTSNSNIVEDFIQQVKTALNRTGMEVKTLADKSGVSRGYIHRLLAGEQNPSLEIAERIAAPLGLTVQTRRLRHSSAGK